jgi:hypothetical protein
MSSADITVKMIFDRWYASINNWNNLLNDLSDEKLQMPIAAGKNRGVYLLGHLIAVHDAMLPLLDMGTLQYPALADTFIKSPDSQQLNIPATTELRNIWNKQCEMLKQNFDKVPSLDWLKKHTAVSDEEFAIEPHRNKLNIILTRTTHLAYHTGQLVLLK